MRLSGRGSNTTTKTAPWPSTKQKPIVATRQVAIAAGRAAVVLVLGDKLHVVGRRAAMGRVGVGEVGVVGRKCLRG